MFHDNSATVYPSYGNSRAFVEEFAHRDDVHEGVAEVGLARGPEPRDGDTDLAHLQLSPVMIVGATGRESA